MADGSSIRDRLRDASGAVALGVDGHVIDRPGQPEPALPTLLVAPVTDALKSLSADGFVTGSLDREEAWRVVGYHLDETISHRLAERDIGIDRIHQEVMDMGLAWQARSIDDL